MQVSANLGFLWKDLPLEQRFINAASVGFKLVETHVCNLSAKEILALQKDLKIQLLQLNAGVGDTTKGEFGLGAKPATSKRFIAEIEEAIEKCLEVGAKNVHCVAGDCLPIDKATGIPTLLENLRILAPKAEKAGLTLVLEPLNPIDRPNYIYSTLKEVVAICAIVNSPNLKAMADLYHVARAEGDVTRKISQYKNYIGHFQAASVPLRRELDEGELNYKEIIAHIKREGLHLPLGLEYNPKADVKQGLGFMKAYGLNF